MLGLAGPILIAALSQSTLTLVSRSLCFGQSKVNERPREEGVSWRC
jgi:hypothetical protein